MKDAPSVGGSTTHKRHTHAGDSRMSKLIIENDNGKAQEFVYKEIHRSGKTDDGRVLLKVHGFETTVGPGVEGVFTIKADQIQQIV